MVAEWPVVFLLSIRHSEHQANREVLCFRRVQLVHCLHVLHQRCVCDTLGNCSQDSVSQLRAVVKARSSNSSVRPAFAGGGWFILGLQIFGAQDGVCREGTDDRLHRSLLSRRNWHASPVVWPLTCYNVDVWETALGRVSIPARKRFCYSSF